MRHLIPYAIILLACSFVTEAIAGERMLYCIASERQATATCTLENGEGGPNDHFEAEFPSMTGGYALPAEFAFAVRLLKSAQDLQGAHEPEKGGYGASLATLAAPEGSAVMIDTIAAGPMTLRSVKLTVDPALL